MSNDQGKATTESISNVQGKAILQEAAELIAILFKSVETARKNKQR